MRWIIPTAVLLLVLGGTLDVHAKKKKKQTASSQTGSALAVSDFDKLVLGKSSKEDVVRELGKPNWRFIHLAPKGEVPINPKHQLEPAVEGDTKVSDLEKLWVYEYWTKDSTRSYYVVLRKDHVYYWIGPVGDDEKTVADLEKRYGKVEITNEMTAQGHRVEGLEVARFDKVIFLRPTGADEFNAKLVRPHPAK